MPKRLLVLGPGLILALLTGSATATPVTVAAVPMVTPMFDGPVLAVAAQGDTVFVGGDFSAAIVRGRSVPRQRLAAVDIATGALLDWAPTADLPVRALTVAGDKVWLAGDFQTVSGQVRDGIARVAAVGAGALDPMAHKIVDGTPRALAAGHARVYAAGLFTGVDTQVRSNLAAFDPVTGDLDATWTPTTDDLVLSLVATADRLYLGGAFHRTNDVSSTGRLIALTPTGAVDLAFRPGPDAIVHAMAVTDDRVYAALGGRGGRTVSYTTGGTALWTLTTDGDAQALAALEDVIYIGGHFDNVCRTARTGDQGTCLDGALTRVKLAAADRDGNLLDWSPTANGVRGVQVMRAHATMIVTGGEFTTIGGLNQKRFAIFG